MARPTLWRRTLSGLVAAAITLTGIPPTSTFASSALPPTLPSSTTSTSSPLTLPNIDVGSLTVPESLGQIIERWQPTDQPATGLVLHLQDLHAHPEAQRHLSELIGSLHEQLGTQLVALEGAEGLCDTARYSSLPDPPTTERIARLFLREGLFTGAEYYGITHPGQVTLWGVEDEASYLAHLATYRDSAVRQTDVDAALNRLHTSLKRITRLIVPASLRRLAILRDDSLQHETDRTFRAYLKALLQLARAGKVDLRPYPQVRRVARMSRQAAMLDARTIEAERQRLLAALWPRLTHEERDRVRHHAKGVVDEGSAASREGRGQSHASISSSQFDEALAQLAQAHGRWSVPVSRSKPSAFPAFRRYLSSLYDQRALQPAVLEDELDALHEAVEERVSRAPAQRRLIATLRRVRLLSDLLHLDLAPRQWRLYQAHRATLRTDSLWDDLVYLTDGSTPIGRAELAQLFHSVPLAERFYNRRGHI